MVVGKSLTGRFYVDGEFVFSQGVLASFVRWVIDVEKRRYTPQWSHREVTALGQRAGSSDVVGRRVAVQ